MKLQNRSLQIEFVSSYLQTQLIFLSGKTGSQIGTTVVLDSTDTANHLIYCTREGSYYVLLQKGR